MLTKSLQYYDEVFDYKESLKISKISHESVLKLKDRVKNNKNIPVNFPDRMVKRKKRMKKDQSPHLVFVFFLLRSFCRSFIIPVTLTKPRIDWKVISNSNELHLSFLKIVISLVNRFKVNLTSFTL